MFWIKKKIYTSKAKAPGVSGIRLQRSCAIWCLGISLVSHLSAVIVARTLTVRFNPSGSYTHNTNETHSAPVHRHTYRIHYPHKVQIIIILFFFSRIDTRVYVYAFNCSRLSTSLVKCTTMYSVFTTHTLPYR